MLTLENLDTSQTVELDAGLIWSDEFGWSAVEQHVSRSITGVLIVETATKQGGRPLTLTNDDAMNWCRRADLLLLQQWCNTPACRLQVTLQDGRQYAVTPDCTSGNAIAAKPVNELPSYGPDDEFHISIKLFEIAL